MIEHFEDFFWSSKIKKKNCFQDQLKYKKIAIVALKLLYLLNDLFNHANSYRSTQTHNRYLREIIAIKITHREYILILIYEDCKIDNSNRERLSIARWS